MSQERKVLQVKYITNVDQDWVEAENEVNTLLSQGWKLGEFRFNDAIMVQQMIKYEEE